MNTLTGGGGGAASSLVIVPVATASLSVAPPVGLLSVTANVSSGSKPVSPAMGIAIVALVWPSAKVTVPVSVAPASRSAALAPAGKLTVHVAATAPSSPAVRVTVNVIVAVPESPSTTAASAIDNWPGNVGSTAAGWLVT